jgi:hypothetical protein
MEQGKHVRSIGGGEKESGRIESPEKLEIKELEPIGL